MFTLENFFCHAWLIHVTVEQIQSRVYMSLCRGGAFRVVASIHLTTLDAGLLLGLLLGCCRADVGLLLNGCRISPWASVQTAAELLLESCCWAGGKLLLKLRGLQSYFVASFGPRFGIVRNPWFKTLGAQFKCTCSGIWCFVLRRAQFGHRNWLQKYWVEM